MSTLKTTNLQHASAASPAIVLAADGSATAQLSSVNGGPLSGSRNRIINGDMRIDQRNNGASVAITALHYPVDRFTASLSQGSGHTTQRSTVAPSGFSNSLQVTVGTGASPIAAQISRIYQVIEGFNVSDLAWGTASAQAITLSFWVRSSVTGTYAGSVYNGSSNRAYIFTYAIASANTWEYKTVTIPGDTTGTWATDNTSGIIVNWDLGTGSTYQGTAGSWYAGVGWATAASVKLGATSGATFYITGVQLEPGTVATPFERRSYGQELALCQRYYASTQVRTGGYNVAGSALRTSLYFPVAMRAAPTLSGSVIETANANNYTYDSASTTTARYLHNVIATGDAYTQATVTLTAEL